MHSDRTLVELVGLVYEAAGNPDGWVPVLERLGQVLRAPWCVFYVHDFTHRTVDIDTAIGFDPAYLRSYEEHYVSKNVFLINGKELLQPGVVGPTTRLCRDSVLTRSEFFNEWLLPQGMCHGINATVLRTKSLSACSE